MKAVLAAVRSVRIGVTFAEPEIHRALAAAFLAAEEIARVRRRRGGRRSAGGEA